MMEVMACADSAGWAADAWEFISTQVMPGLNKGFIISLKLIVPSALFGLFLGILVGALRVFGGKWIGAVMEAYVSVFRGTPLVVQLFFWYFGLPEISRSLVLSGMQSAILGFTLCSAAYHSEYIRGGLLSIKKGQLRAAMALGMTPYQAVRHVVLPQAIRRALPGCGNEIIYLIKYSSLASIITVNEMTGVGRAIAKSTWKNTEVYLVVGLYYLALVTLATLVLRWVENRLSLPGFERRKG